MCPLSYLLRWEDGWRAGVLVLCFWASDDHGVQGQIAQPLWVEEPRWVFLLAIPSSVVSHQCPDLLSWTEGDT